MTTDLRYNAAAGERYALVLKLLKQRSAPPAKVLELGAAPGEQSVLLAEAGYDVTAVDIGIASDDWQGAEEGTMEKRFADAGVELVLWNLEEPPYPLPDDTYDAVVLTEVFEHLRDYPVTALKEARRVLKPGGSLFLTTPNAAYIKNRLQLLRGRNTATKLEDWIGGLPFARHAREYTFDEMAEMMRVAGLEVTESLGRHLHTQSGNQSPVARLGKQALDRLAQARPTLGPAIVMVAQRPGD
jgi:SAM-dependent methyltransferase